MKKILLILLATFATFLCYSQDISGKYYYNKSESNIEEIVDGLIKDNPLLILVLSDSTRSKEIFDMMPKQITISDSKIYMITPDGKEEMLADNIQIKKNGKNNYTIISTDINEQSKGITFYVKNKQKILNWQGFIYKTN